MKSQDNYKLPWHAHRARTAEEVEAVVRDQLKVRVRADGDCLLWTGGTTHNGYGKLNGTNSNSPLHWRAHVAAHQLFKGPVPQGLMVCHSCDRPGCVNPEHLWLGTNQDNQLDASKKGVFDAYWTEERRAELSRKYAGENGPMYGMKGELAPCYGRTGAKHPMFGKHHSEETKAQISRSLLNHWNKS